MALLGALAVPALAHPFHASSAQADFNRDTQRLEIAIRIFAEDLLDAVNVRREQRLSYEKSPAAELDTALHGYVSARFAVAGGDGVAVPLRWVGREFDRSTEHKHDVEQSLWLYVEAALPGGIEGARLHHALLQEHVRDQTNTVRVRDGAREVVLAFPPRSGPKTVRFKAD